MLGTSEAYESVKPPYHEHCSTHVEHFPFKKVKPHTNGSELVSKSQSSLNQATR